MRISALYQEGTANAYYRVVLPLRELQRRGHDVVWPSDFPPERVLATAPPFDVYVIHHFFDSYAARLAAHCRRHRVAVVWDVDDDISNVPKHVKTYKAYGGRRGVRKCFKQAIAMGCEADLMTTPSAHLALHYRAHGVERTQVIENYVARDDIARPRRRHHGLVIGMTAAEEHRLDVERLHIADVLRRLMLAHPEIHVMTFGIGLDLPPSRNSNYRQIPIHDLIGLETQFDIGLAPLADTPFNRSRSNVKLKEYAAAGAMWLASPTGPFAEMDESSGGLLVEDGAWYEALDAVVRDPERRLALAKNARAWARRQTVDRAAGRWEASFRSALRHAREK